MHPAIGCVCRPGKYKEESSEKLFGNYIGQYLITIDDKIRKLKIQERILSMLIEEEDKSNRLVFVD